MTREQLLAELLVERYAPTRPEAVGGWAREPMRTDDSELTTARRRRELDAALEGYEDHRGRGAA
ncbi:hypothetical protein [Jiangella asiatica]|uniref:Uncharacterized protein n=1 Tax=Jiangella asiatica TaxID=2530372 RepID=A0A4R5CZQ6_9ACTN|nr:hypothetical protein [Jiangella asiatica]TDE03445.1 hypothetical protein E1269_20625 [Jiangella asiatica]